MATINQIKRIALPLAVAKVTGKPNASRLAIHLAGAPGIGKSACVFQLAKEVSAAVGFDVPVFEVRGPTLADPSFVTGIPDISGTVTVLKRMNILPPENTPCILFIDELGATHPQIRNALTQVIYDLKAGEYQLDPRTFIITAGNRVTDRAGATKLETHVANRLRHFTIEADLVEWQTYIADKGMNPLIVAFLDQHPDLLHKFDPKSDDPAFPSPRTWEEVAIDMELLHNPNDLLMSVASLVGEGPATMFQAFMLQAATLPKWEDQRTKNPKEWGEELKKMESSVQYTAMTMFANAVKDKDDVDWAVEALETVSPELTVGFANMANTVFRKFAVTSKSPKLLAFAKRTGADLFRA